MPGPVCFQDLKGLKSLKRSRGGTSLNETEVLGNGQQSRSDLLLDVSRRLGARYGVPIWNSHGTPLDELIATVLSQHTSDTNTARSFAALRGRFPEWDDVIAAPTSEVADAIRMGGLANVKAPRIQRILHEVRAQTGSPALDWLRTVPREDARNWLLGLPGVGPKTAACVLLFSLGLPTMPVDTHVHRVSRRLGLVGADVNAEDAHVQLDGLIGEDRNLSYALHLNLIRHGREICRARKPACERCCLADVCPSAQFALAGPD